jgi:prolipoprotein diacylglyceryltransferase
MKIAVSHPGFYFAFFYLLSFAFVFTTVIVFALKKGYPLRSVLLMLTTISLCTIVGSRLFTIPLSEWGHVIRAGSLSEYYSRSALGGLIFGLAGLIFSQRFFGFNRPILDLYAWITPVGFGIQKVGCLLNGCCYGKSSRFPWSIQYTEGSQAHFNHMASGLIEKNAAYSLSVHPVQLYETIILFAIAWFVWRTARHWKKSGSALLFSLFLFILFRFTIEFIRDPTASLFNSHYLFGIRVFQWILLFTGLVIGLLLLLYEGRLKTDILYNSHIELNLRGEVFYILIIAALIYLFRGLFSIFELIALEMRFIPAVLLTGIYLYKVFTAKKYRLATCLIIILSFFLMSQSLPKDSTEQNKYTRIDLGTTIGRLYSELAYNPHPGACGGTAYTREDYENLYRMGGIGFSKVTESGEETITYGINAFGGINRETNLTLNQENTFILGGINPYIKYDLRWIGMGVGAHFGNLRWVPVSPIDAKTYNNGTKFSPILPEFYFRVGRRDILDLETAMGFQFPSPLPALSYHASLGSGFGLTSDYSLRVGFFLPSVSGYISAEGLVSKNFGVSLMYLAGRRTIYYLPYGNSPTLSIGLNYRF